MGLSCLSASPLTVWRVSGPCVAAESALSCPMGKSAPEAVDLRHLGAAAHGMKTGGVVRPYDAGRVFPS